MRLRSPPSSRKSARQSKTLATRYGCCFASAAYGSAVQGRGIQEPVMSNSENKQLLPIIPAENIIITEADENHALGSDELKACPHCGRWAFSAGEINPKTGNTVYRVYCTGRDCMAQTSYCAKDPAEARVGAIKRWNRRVEHE